MNGQSSHFYRERKGRAVTRRSTGHATLDVTSNVTLRARAIQLPAHQLAQNGNGSPDAAGLTRVWPNEGVRSGV